MDKPSLFATSIDMSDIADEFEKYVEKYASESNGADVVAAFKTIKRCRKHAHELNVAYHNFDVVEKPNEKSNE